MSKPEERAIPDKPEYRPTERFWPYADLSEQPSDEELAALHPELRSALFGSAALPFSISIVFPSFEGSNAEQAIELAKAADEYVVVESNGVTTHRARFYPGPRALALRDLYQAVGDVAGTEVLVDDQPVPYARELWLPLVWLLIR